MMAHSTWHIQFGSQTPIVYFLIYIVTTILLLGNVSAQIEKQPWYEAMPAVAMDYKVHLPAGKEDCYYQYVQPGATLYVSFQVSHRVSLSFFHIIISPSCAIVHISIYFNLFHQQISNMQQVASKLSNIYVWCAHIASIRTKYLIRIFIIF